MKVLMKESCTILCSAEVHAVLLNDDSIHRAIEQLSAEYVMSASDTLRLLECDRIRICKKSELDIDVNQPYYMIDNYHFWIVDVQEL